MLGSSQSRRKNAAGSGCGACQRRVPCFW